MARRITRSSKQNTNSESVKHALSNDTRKNSSNGDFPKPISQDTINGVDTSGKENDP